MIFACYQLIPKAPQPPTELSVFMFVAQFVALDVGGLGLNQIARRQGLPIWSYARIVAYCLIGITLITITYAGIEHAIPGLDPQVTVVVEVILVIARSVMTVLYGQAIHSLKTGEHIEQDRRAELEQEGSTLREQLKVEQQTVSSLRVQLDSAIAELDSERKKVSRLTAEVDTLRVQLDGKDQQLTSLKESMTSGIKWHESNSEMLLKSVQSQLDSEREKVSSLQKRLDTIMAELDTPRVQMDSGQDEEDTRVIHLDTNRTRKNGHDENVIGEQIRVLLKAEPGLSGRAIATRIGCSPTTATKWKSMIEKEEATKCAHT
jgi:hypothetical protein